MAARSDRERQIGEEIANLERVAALAEDTAKPGDAIKAIQHLGRLRGELARIKAIKLAESSRDPVKRLRSLSKIAANEGSWVASGQLAAEAARIELEARRIDEQRKAAEMDNLSPEDLVQILVQSIDSLPVDAVRMIRSSVERRMVTERDG